MGVSILKIKWHLSAGIRKALYKLLYGSRFSAGKGTTFRRGLSVYLEGKGDLRIGKDCFFNHYCSINVLDQVEIGDGCIFGEGVKLYDHNHRFADDTQKIKDQGFSVAPVKIGSHCWFGSNVVILKGCTIGDNCVIGAGCVISQPIPDNSVVSMNRELSIVPIRK